MSQKDISVEQRLFELLNTFDKKKDNKAKTLLDEKEAASNDLNINWIDEKDILKRGFLHVTCFCDRHEMIGELLKHSKMDLNARDKGGRTPFIWACASNTAEGAILLLNDARVDINCKDNQGDNGLMRAASHGRIKTIEQILASLRHISKADIKSAIKEAKRQVAKYPDIVSLLEAYHSQRFETLKNLRSKLKLLDYGPVSLFVLVVLLADDYYALKQQEDGQNAVRFFNLVLKLPMDLQMVVCNRLYDLPGDFIRTNLVNLALKFMVTDGILK